MTLRETSCRRNFVLLALKLQNQGLPAHQCVWLQPKFNLMDFHLWTSKEAAAWVQHASEALDVQTLCFLLVIS